MAEADIPEEIAPDRQPLSDREKSLLETFFERGGEDTRSEATQTVAEKIREYEQEVVEAAKIARAQFDQKFGGMNPGSGRFGIRRTHSGFFGYDSWEGNANLTGMTAGAPVAWINDGAPDNLGGTDTTFGNPLKVGDQAVHVIVGVGTYSPSPKLSGVEWEVNEEPRSIVHTKYEWTRTDLGIKWLDRALILPENALFEAQAYPDVGGDDAPYLVGLSFIEHRASQVLDPANMTDDTQSTSDNIVAQG